MAVELDPIVYTVTPTPSQPGVPDEAPEICRKVNDNDAALAAAIDAVTQGSVDILRQVAHFSNAGYELAGLESFTISIQYDAAYFDPLAQPLTETLEVAGGPFVSDNADPLSKLFAAIQSAILAAGWPADTAFRNGVGGDFYLRSGPLRAIRAGSDFYPVIETTGAPYTSDIAYEETATIPVGANQVGANIRAGTPGEWLALPLNSVLAAASETALAASLAVGEMAPKLDEIRQDVVVTPFTPAVQTGTAPLGSGATLLSSLGITDAHSPLTVYSFNPTLPPPGNPPVASGAFAFADVTGLTVQDLIDGINGAQSFCVADLDGSGQLRFTQTSTDPILITFSAFGDVIVGCVELGFGDLFTQISNHGAQSAPEHTKLIDADHVGVENVFTFGDRNDVQAELRAAKVSVDMKANTPNKRMSGYRARIPAFVGTRTTLLSAVVGLGAINAGDTLTFSNFKFMDKAQQPVAPTVPYPPKTYTVVDPATETIGDVIDFFAEAYDYTCPVTTQGDAFATAYNFGPDFGGAFAVAPNVVLSGFQISGALAYKLRLSGAPSGNYLNFSPVELTSNDVFMPEKGLLLSSTSTAIAEATTDGSGNFTMVFSNFYPFIEDGAITSPIVLLDTKFFTGIVFKTGIAGYFPFRITGKVVDASLAPIAGITVLGMCFAASPSAL